MITHHSPQFEWYDYLSKGNCITQMNVDLIFDPCSNLNALVDVISVGKKALGCVVLTETG